MKREYPYYGKSKQNGVIVYFTSFETGIVIDAANSKDHNDIFGHWIYDWREYDVFEIITNKQKIKQLDKIRLLLNL